MNRWRNSELARFLVESGPSVLFSAALVLIIEHLGWLTALSRLSLLIVSNLAATQARLGPQDFSHGPYVFAIDEADFQGRYHERSPLDHCLLADDLARLYGRAPAAVGVDLDLSPPSGATLVEQACQRRLDALLDQHASQTTLIVPEPVASAALRRQKLDWMSERCAAGVRFASPYIERSLGVVIDQREEVGDSLAALVTRPRANPLCATLAATPAQVGQHWLDSARAPRAHDDRDGERRPINFALAAQHVPAPIPVASAAHAWPTLAGATVFFGGDYGRDDSYTTPIGEASGLWIHAARMVTLAHPIETLPAWLGLVADVVSGFAFALLIRRFWELFARSRCREEEHERWRWGPFRVRPAWSSLVLVSFLLAYLLLCLALFFVARYLFFQWGLIIAPLLMALGMLLDGFITGEVLSGELILARAGSTQAPQQAIMRATCYSILAVLLAWGVFVALVMFTAQPGFWLLGALVTLLLLICARLWTSVEAEPVRSQPASAAASGLQCGLVNAALANVGWVLGGARIVIFLGVVGYASWILAP